MTISWRRAVDNLPKTQSMPCIEGWRHEMLPSLRILPCCKQCTRIPATSYSFPNNAVDETTQESEKMPKKIPTFPYSQISIWVSTDQMQSKCRIVCFPDETILCVLKRLEMKLGFPIRQLNLTAKGKSFLLQKWST